MLNLDVHMNVNVSYNTVMFIGGLRAPTRTWKFRLLVTLFPAGMAWAILLATQDMVLLPQQEYTSQQKKKPSPAISQQELPPRIPQKSPNHVYWCGYHNMFDQFDFNVGNNLFPEVNVSELEKDSPLDPNDVLLYPCGGPCALRLNQESAAEFPGKILTFNGESSSSTCIQSSHDKVFTVSPVDRGHIKKKQHNPSAYPVSMHLQSLSHEWQNKIYDPQHHPRNNTRERFLIYAVSNCVSYREIAFSQLSGIGKVDYAGRCKGRSDQYGNKSNIQEAPRDGNGGYGSWGMNHIYFNRFRFALVMENKKASGYVTEKIINAFLAGCIPIYYGTEEVFDLFNKDAFIYWNISDSTPSLEKIAYLENNITAYDEMTKQPVLAHGRATIEQHFSWSDQIGGGRLKWEIREMLGYG